MSTSLVVSSIRTFAPKCAAAIAVALAFAVPALVEASSQAEAIDDSLPWPDGHQGEDTLRLALSKSRYHAEDVHLDAIAELGQAAAKGWKGVRVEVRMYGEGERTPVHKESFAAPGRRFICYPGIPDELVGGRGRLKMLVRAGEEELSRADVTFRVAERGDVPREGRVPLRIPNPSGATVQGLPQTVGVPFPRGALNDQADVRLVDGDGREIPLQTKVTGRWSRYGYIKWLQCDFTVDLDGESKEIYLEYGSEVSRRVEGGLKVIPARHAPLVPRVESGAISLGAEGLGWDADGLGAYEPVVEMQRLEGAFVERDDERFYEEDPIHHPAIIEERGPEKAVIRRDGRYVNFQDWPDAFCEYRTRYVIHRGSPFVRVFHTWIFTGDGNEDRIKEMGWQFHTADGFTPMGVLREFERNELGDGVRDLMAHDFRHGGQWAEAEYIVQHDFDGADLGMADGSVRQKEMRAAGVLAMEGNGTRVYFGVKDFWQNYPREVRFDEGAMVFNEWPRHGRAERRTTTLDNMMRLWFAHEGKHLDFRLPDEYAEDPIHSRLRHETYWPKGKPESVNAQGVAKTTEFWLYLTDDQTPVSEAERVLRGLNDETLRAVVAPEWVASSGAFYEMHHLDAETYPAEEVLYENVALAPLLWVERMPIYGKWLWGNMYFSPNLESRRAGIYRGLRKSHQGWPYSWVPFARSGDARYLKFAEAATRTMTDANFTHYSDHRTGNRQRGVSERSALPWTRVGRLRDYSEQSDYKLHAYYLTGYRRAKDVLLDWGDLVKQAHAEDGRVALAGPRAPRRAVNLLKAYVEMYQATFDPWFIMAAHVIAQREDPWNERRTHSWQPGNREYNRFTGCEKMERFYLEVYAPPRIDPFNATGGFGTAPQLEQAPYAYHLTGEEYYARRIEGWISDLRASVYDADEPWYRRGTVTSVGTGTQTSLFTGWFLDDFPMMLGALAEAPERPKPEPAAFYQAPAVVEHAGDGEYRWDMPVVAVKKKAGEALSLDLDINVDRRPPENTYYDYELIGPDGATIEKGAWDIAQVETVEVPAGSPAGVYRVDVKGIEPYAPYGYEPIRWMQAFRALRVPLSEPGVPEVIELDGERRLGTAFYRAKYWVYVPEDCDSFEVQFALRTKESPGTPVLPINRVAVFDPEGELVWKEQHLITDYDGDPEVRARIEVPAEHRGELWRIAAPGWSGGIRISPEVSSAVAVSPDRWFEPPDF